MASIETPSAPILRHQVRLYSYSKLGIWMLAETVPSGTAILAISISNLTFTRTYLSTTFSLVISKVNETVDGAYVNSISLRVAALKVEDNYDGNTTSWGKSNEFSDAVQVFSIQFFQTSGDHQMRFTVTYELYGLLTIGYTPKRSVTRLFNVTQSIL